MAERRHARGITRHGAAKDSAPCTILLHALRSSHIDEMMTQFKGREEELVETLRRMQERAIASRARLAVQKSAKLEARGYLHQDEEGDD